MRLVAMLGVVLLAGCSLMPGPKPPKPPVTPEPLPELEWCHDLAVKCGPCKHNPTADPAHAERFDFPACSGEPGEPVLDCLVPPDEPKSNWATPIKPGDRPASKETKGAIASMVAALGDACGTDPVVTLERAALLLRSWGWCAARATDSLTIRGLDGVFEEWHMVPFFPPSNQWYGCWTNSGHGRYRNGWPYLADWPASVPVDPSEPPEEPEEPEEPVEPPEEPEEPVEPPTPEGCGNPVPARLNSDGNPHYILKCKVHGRVVDCTPTMIRSCDFCEEIGLGEFNGRPRCGCPVRHDGHAEREPCEGYLLGGAPVLEGRNGATCEGHRSGNPFLFIPNDNNCRLCNPAHDVCGDWF